MFESNLKREWRPPEISITGKAGKEYKAASADKIPLNGKQSANIAKICNQESIYWLFSKRLGGRPYGREDADNFLNWAHRGWREQTHFVFLVSDSSELVVAALDIKSADRSMAEIGYWCSESHRGLMSNAIEKLLLAAREEGFACLFARVRKDNLPSQKVLEKNSFKRIPESDNDSIYYRYEICLLDEG